MADAIFDSPIGPLYALATAEGLRRLEFVRGGRLLSANEGVSFDDSDPEGRAIVEDAQRQLAEYFEGDRREFNLPLVIEGSDFQVRVWQAIARIPYGEVLSYADVAAAAGSPGAFRAAGSACSVFDAGALCGIVQVSIRGRSGSVPVWLWQSGAHAEA